MIFLNSKKAYEEVRLFNGADLIGEGKATHTTFAKAGYASKQDAENALFVRMAGILRDAIRGGEKSIFFNRTGPHVEKTEDGDWKYRWRCSFINFSGTHFEISNEARYEV